MHSEDSDQTGQSDLSESLLTIDTFVGCFQPPKNGVLQVRDLLKTLSTERNAVTVAEFGLFHVLAFASYINVMWYSTDEADLVSLNSFNGML